MSDTADSIPAGVVALGDYEPHARARLDANAWAYLTGGGGDNLTQRDNRAAFDRLRLHGRVLGNVAGGHTRLDLLGHALAHPLLVAPMAWQRLFHPHGELATARAAAALEAALVVSSYASHTLENIATAGRGAPLWFQLYVQPDRGYTLALAERARAAGYSALVVTVDAPIPGVRNDQQRAGFALPPGIGSVNLADMPAPPPLTGPSPVFDRLMPHAPTWADLDRLRATLDLPLIVKGVLHPDDARAARDHGADAVVVSNHGGRTLDTLPASLDALPAVAAAVGAGFPLLLDGGIRRGTDVLKALALGARAVLVGRPLLHALATAGALGVAHTLRILREELEVAMALSGCRTLADIGPQVLFSSSCPKEH